MEELLAKIDELLAQVSPWEFVQMAVVRGVAPKDPAVLIMPEVWGQPN